MRDNRGEPTAVAARFALSTRRRLWELFAVCLAGPIVVESAVLIATNATTRFVVLLGQAVPIVVVAWPISALLLIWIERSFESALRRNQLQSRQLLWLVPLVLLPITMLVWGAVFAHPRGRGFIHWQLTVVHWMFYSSIISGLLAVIFNRGRRSFVSSVTSMLLLLSFSCSLTAGSSITGDWL